MWTSPISFLGPFLLFGDEVGDFTFSKKGVSGWLKWLKRWDIVAEGRDSNGLLRQRLLLKK